MDSDDERKIDELEGQLLAEKPWQLKGEVGAHARPVNSLLFEDVKFEQRAKAPLITPEVTESIESMIKARIKDNKFDNPVRKIKPKRPETRTRQVEVSQEKSKVGLAQIYEQELLSKASTTQAEDSTVKNVEKKMFALFKKLDALAER